MVYYVRIPLRSGGSIKKTTGTSDRATSRRIEAMVKELASRHEWEILDAVTGGASRRIDVGGTNVSRTRAELSLRELFAAYASNGLRELKAQQSDVDLAAYVTRWQTWLRSRLGADAESVAHYLACVRTLIPADERFPRSEFTKHRIEAWLSSREVASATRRKYRAALSSFAKYLTVAGVLDANPVREVEPPKPGKPRDKYLEQPQILELLVKLPEPFRTIEALIHGTGMEISAALRVRRMDVNTERRTVEAHGTKTDARERTCAISDWAWVYLERHLARIPDRPDALLFDGVSRWSVSDAHRAACVALGGAHLGYRVHDARRSYAVRLVRVGAPMEVAAAQLGHKSTQMVAKVYGRFRPSEDEVRKWEKLAAAREEEQRTRKGAK